MRTTRSVPVSALCLLAGLSTAARAEEPLRETRPADVVIENGTAGPLSCGLLFAHWYRQDYPPIPAGGKMVLPLRISPADETVYLVNSVGRPMAVETFYCAGSGAAWKDIRRLDYRALALEAAGGSVRLACSGSAAVISCGIPTQ